MRIMQSAYSNFSKNAKGRKSSISFARKAVLALLLSAALCVGVIPAHADTDTAAPVLTHTLSSEGWTNTSVTVNLSVTDNGGSGVSQVAYKRATDDVYTVLWSGSQDAVETSFSTTANGAYKVRLVDVAGNDDVRDVIISTIDRTAPTFSSVKTPGGWTVEDVTVTISATDAGGSGVNKIWYKVPGATDFTLLWSNADPANNHPTSQAASFIAEERGRYRVKIADVAGNEYTGSVQISNIDRTVPDTPDVYVTNTSGDDLVEINGRKWSNEDVMVHIREAEQIATSFLTFSSPNAFTLSSAAGEKTWDGILEYSTNLTSWTTWDGTTSIDSSSDATHVLYVRGTGNTIITGAGETVNWVLDGSNIECSGNIEYLLDYNTAATGEHPTMGDKAFRALFEGCSALTSAPELPAEEMTESCYAGLFRDCVNLDEAPELPATTLAPYCYNSMFRGCTGLTMAPELNAATMANYCYQAMFYECTGLIAPPALPATTLAEGCYQGIFFGCSNMVDATELPATTLAERCYARMFEGCNSLAEAPELSVTTLAPYCYEYMFEGCTGLATAPELPATTLAQNCYSSMFNGCTSLTTAPELPATTLAIGCYNCMFSSCTSLTTTPELPATTLAQACYANMFFGCESLTSANELPATTLAERCYEYMFFGCKSLTTPPELPATTLKTYCYSSMFSGCTSLKLSATKTNEYGIPYRVPISGDGVTASSALTFMFAGTGGTFTGTPEINRTYYLWGRDPADTAIKFSSEDAFTLATANHAKNWDGTLEYSTDLKNWTTWDGTTTLNSSDGTEHVLYVRGTGNSVISRGSGKGWTLTGTNISCSGNIENLLNHETVTAGGHPSMGNSCYFRMFDGCTGLTTAPELPATTLSSGCYAWMFEDCSLTTAPELPATTLASYCYQSMFKGCTSLATAPELPATVLTGICYREMFRGCTGLTTAPELPATTLASACYDHMFYGCTGLTTAPELPATTLAGRCYVGMFNGCTSLTAAPELPATTLVEACYQGMFGGCTSLAVAPELPATTLASYCYYQMFYGCTSLTTAPELPATTLAEECYGDMFSGCTSLTAAPELPATTLANYCYSGMFYGCTGIKLSATKTNEYGIPYRVPVSGDGVTASNALAGMFTSTGGTFRGTPSINTTYYLWGRDPADTAIKFSSEDAFTLATANGAKNWDGFLEYSTDLESWTTWDGTTTLNSSDGTEHVLYVRGTENSVISGGSGKGWTLTGSNISCSGNIENLLNHETVTAGEHPSMSTGCYAALFYKYCTGLTTAPELPATTLVEGCYRGMFGACTSLAVAPDLPATTLATYCYYSMFNGCTSLTTAPELPATTLANECYYYMFNGCKSLTTAPELPATTLAQSCYTYMFSNCTSLTTPPELPATTLMSWCYQYMFSGCTSLTTAPELPATTLATYCYQNMFYGCTSLTTAPELPATTLADRCYQNMFRGCTSLTAPSELPATTLATYCYQNMFYGCTSLTTAPELPAITLATYCYSNMFYGCTGIKLSATKTNEYGIPYRVPISGNGVTASSALSSMFSSTGGTFRGTPSINTTYYLWGRDPADTAIKFSSEDAFTLATKNSAKNWDGTLEYSTDLKRWTTWDGTTTINSSNGAEHVLYVRGTENSVISGGNGKGWTLTGSNVSCSGNIENLLNHETVTAGGHPSMGSSCYSYLFYNCTSLTSAPELPAIALADYCYGDMFRGCTSLTTTPELPATALTLSCYNGMFRGCTSLTEAPELPATTLANSCYTNMFHGCTSLTTAPELPATTLATDCYASMFYGCTGLTTAPELPATTLADSCYSVMFSGCTGLTTAPELSATTLANYCYYYMFNGCTGLTAPSELPATTLATYCYSNMFYGCTGIKLSATKTSEYGIPYRVPISGNGVTASNALSYMFTSTGGTFRGTPEINRTYYLWGRDPADSTIKFSSEDAFTLATANGAKNWNGTLEYSIDLKNWTTWDGTTTLNSSNGAEHVLYVRGTGNSVISGGSGKRWTLTGTNISCSGNIENLLNHETVTAGEHPNMGESCYGYLFYNCTSLTTAPELPATTLAARCYQSMFRGCTSLTTPPELPATTLKIECYKEMFSGCTGIKLSATKTDEYGIPYRVPISGDGTDATDALSSMFVSTGGTFTGTPDINTTYYLWGRDPADTAIKFSSDDAFTLATANGAKNWDGSLEYSTDLENWTTWDGTTTLNSSDGAEHVLYVRGTDNSVIFGGSGKGWTLAGSDISCSGNIENLLNHETVTAGGHPSMGKYCYSYLFLGCTNLIAAPELPATTLAEYCYDSMFYGCTSLTTAPELPATTLAESCYSGMFRGCTSLTTAPELPATTLASSCYSSMFNGCTSLTMAPELPATALARSCYDSMFRGCTSLTTAPELSATTLADSCYSSMFYNCTSLTTAPELPATTLANYCYLCMFWNCKSLATAPELPATTLAQYCYSYMFSGCTGIKLSATKTNEYGIPYRVPISGDGVTATKDALAFMFSSTGGTFTGTPEINRTYYLWGRDPADTAIKFSSDDAFTLATANGAKNWGGSLEYSTDLKNWTAWDGTTTLNSSDGTEHVLYVRGTENSVISGGSGKRWTLTGTNISCSGNIENLLNHETVTAGEHPSMGTSCYSYLFYNCTSLTTAPELSATTLATHCYQNMFRDCTSLTTAPELPATTLANYCYYYMFNGCTGLTTAPELPATTLASWCYSYMFDGCTSLTTAPELPATTLASGCYNSMFRDCTSLTTPPELPATTLAMFCYSHMFDGCTSLTTAPELPATTLAQNCYQYMFDGCTSLAIAPELPATTLATQCYEYMLSGCTGLTTAPELSATTLATYCYSHMFEGCTGIKLSDTKTDEYGIPYRVPISGDGVTASSALSSMFSSTGGTFTGTPEINTTYYLWGRDPADTAIKFSSEDAFTLATVNGAKNWDGSLEYSTDLENWTAWDGTTTLNSSDGTEHVLYVRGAGNSHITGEYNPAVAWTLTGTNISCSGNIENLLDYEAVTAGEHPSMGDYCYASMFSGCTSLTAAPELPATALASECYSEMFYDCTGLTTAPELPATTLKEGCYDAMFSDCTSLTAAPELPATALASECYQSMFSGCTSLVNAPELPDTTLADGCYRGMFSGCTSLTTAPELPATTLKSYCYAGMFAGCTSLTTAPELPATTLSNSCYYCMFQGCTGLTTAPELPATTLVQSCYSTMFYNCTRLTTAPELPATTLVQGCYQGMFTGCTGIKLSTTKTGAYTIPYRVPSVGDGTTAFDALLDVFTGTGGTFAGTPSINTTYYLYDPEYIAALKFSSPNEFTLATKNSTKNWDGTLQYSTDLDTWNTWDGVTTLNSSDDPEHVLYVRGTGNSVISGGCWDLDNDHGQDRAWVFTGTDISCSGSIENLLDYATVIAGGHPSMGDYCFDAMFCGCRVLVTAPELPAVTLSYHCYHDMFIGCTSLTMPPELPATTLAEKCYTSLFNGCTSLTTAPELPATTLAINCYSYMFSGCTSLTTAPELPATTLADRCYNCMFNGCTSLTTAPELPATTLANYCYDSMFIGCSNIKLSTTKTGAYTIPYRVPKTGSGTTASNALSQMFSGTGGTFAGTPSINTTYYLWDYELEAATLKFSSPSSFSLKTANSAKNWDGTLQYSTNLTSWTTWSGTTTLNAVKNGSEYLLYLRGTGNSVISGEGVEVVDQGWRLTGSNISCSGNVESLLNYETVAAGEHPSMGDYCYACLFADCTSLASAPELPATTLTDGCYEYMFYGCTSLTTPPELPATTLTEWCYDGMFEGCTGLTTAPELPATTLAIYCYSDMFSGCTSLTTAPELPATTLAEYCYESMFEGCTSLKLSATEAGAYTIPYRVPSVGDGTTANYALRDMFTGTGGTFTGTPSINTTYYLLNPEARTAIKFSSPSAFTLATTNSKKNWNGTLQYSTDLNTWNTWDGTTTLNSSADAEHVLYVRGTGNTVISGGNGKGWTLTGSNISCSGNIENLLNHETVTAGEHPSMGANCYNCMFEGCTSLTTTPELPATTLAERCYYQMFCGCTGLTTAPELPATTLTEWCYCNMFRDCTSLKLSTTKTGAYTIPYRVPSVGDGITAAYALTNMFTETGGTFTGTPRINTTYYLAG